jgi:hypothetical protein
MKAYTVDAVLDHLVHTAHRLALDAPSMRDPKRAASAPTIAAANKSAFLAVIAVQLSGDGQHPHCSPAGGN